MKLIKGDEMEEKDFQMLPSTYLLNGKEVQEIFNISLKTLKRWMSKGVNVPVVIVGRSRRYPYGEMKKFFEKRTYTNLSKNKKWSSVNIG